jgi:hypothetical protein
MNEIEEETKRRVQGRSPPFPFIPLERAVDRVEKLLDYSKGHPVRLASAVTAWGYQPKSSGGSQTIAALKSFGLITDSGSNDDRKVVVSDLARRLLRGPPPDVRRELLRKAALSSKVIAEYWLEWNNDRPPDSDCRWELVDNRGFTDEAATKFLQIYDSTIAYAGLGESDMVTDEADDVPPPLTVEDSSMEKQPSQLARFASGSLPATAEATPIGMRKAVFPVSEGDVTIIFPTNLSPDGLEELGDYLEIFLRKAKREIEKGQSPLNG